MYTHFWSSYKQSSLRRLTVAYNDPMRLLLQVPRWYRATYLFVLAGVKTCEAFFRNLIYKCMCCLDASVNSILEVLTSPRCLRFSHRLRKTPGERIFRHSTVLLLQYSCIIFIQSRPSSAELRWDFCQFLTENEVRRQWRH